MTASAHHPSPPGAPPDEAERRRIRDDLDATLFVEAGAGAGKTSSLVARIVNLVRSGVPITGIAAITFTEKAAAELRSRTRQRLEAEPGPETDPALARLDHAPIGTLHSFARRILFDFPIDAVLTDCRWPAGTQAALRHAHANGVPSVVDVDRRIADPETRRIVFELGTHLVFSEDALCDTTGCVSSADGLRMIAEQTRAHVSVTLGERGVQWLDGDVVESIDAFAVFVVDTAAAGDVFHGAFALALAEGLDEPAGFRFAAAAAALKCARPGARAGMPDRSAVEELVARSLTVTR